VRIQNPSKALILLVGLLSIVLLMILDKITAEQGFPILSAVVFYSIGNGVQARTGKPSDPVIGPKDEKLE